MCVCVCVILWVVSVSVGVGASQKIPLSVLVRNSHKGPACKISHETGSEQGKEGLREDRRTQSAEESSRDQSA